MASMEPVIIAGAGPVGVVAALALAQQGIPVRVFEAAERINDAPRASTLHPATLEMLSVLGILNARHCPRASCADVSVLGSADKTSYCGI